MNTGRDEIADGMKAEAFKVKCKNCIGLETHGSYNWCDFWSTTVDDAEKAFCSYFLPCLPKENEHASDH